MAEELKLWEIYHADREYARTLGDPCIAGVWARDEAHAIAVASRVLFLPTGAIAICREMENTDD